MNESRVAEVIRSRYTTLSNNQQEIFDRVEQYKAMYHCQMTEDESYPWEYQLTDAQIFPTIRNYLSRMNPAEARIALTGKSPYREVNQQLVNWELNEILITMLMYKIMYSGFMAGRGYFKTGWFYKPALKIKTDNGEKIMRSLQNRADSQFVRFNNLFIPNRNIPEIELQPYLIELVDRRFGDMLDEQEQTEYWKPDLLQKIREKKMFTHEINYGVDLPNEETGEEETIIRSQNVSMLRMTTMDGEEFWTLKDGDDKQVLNKDTHCKYWHGHYDYGSFAPFPEDDEFFSMGVPHTIADLEIALSSTLNQLLTNGRKAGNSMWLVGDSGKQVPDWMFTDRPNGIVRVKGKLDDYKRLDFNTQASRETLQLRQALQTSSERTSGISSLYSSGVGDGGQVNKTARGAEVISNNIDQNLQLLISLYGAQVLKTMGEHFVELNQQYITEEQTFEITGKHGQDEYVTVQPEQISADFKVKASPERLLRSSPAVKLASLQNTITTLESQKTVKVDMEPLYEELISETPGLEDIDPQTIIIDPEKRANEAINMIMKGFDPPKLRWDDDFKSILTLVQKHLLDMDHPPEELEKFVAYITDLKGWLQAKNESMVIPSSPIQGAAEPQLLPTDPNSLAQSMSIPMNMNPTEGMAAPLTQAQLGG